MIALIVFSFMPVIFLICTNEKFSKRNLNNLLLSFGKESISLYNSSNFSFSRKITSGVLKHGYSVLLKSLLSVSFNFNLLKYREVVFFAMVNSQPLKFSPRYWPLRSAQDVFKNVSCARSSAVSLLQEQNFIIYNVRNSLYRAKIVLNARSFPFSNKRARSLSTRWLKFINVYIIVVLMVIVKV